MLALSSSRRLGLILPELIFESLRSLRSSGSPSLGIPRGEIFCLSFVGLNGVAAFEDRLRLRVGPTEPL